MRDDSSSTIADVRAYAPQCRALDAAYRRHCGVPWKGSLENLIGECIDAIHRRTA